MERHVNCFKTLPPPPGKRVYSLTSDVVSHFSFKKYAIK